MGKHKIIKSAAAVALTASVVATAAPGASAASYKTNAKDQLVHTSTGKLVKGWKVFGGKLYKNGKLAPAKKYKIIGTGAAQKLFYGPTLKKGYKTANSKTLLFKDGKLADGWKQAGKNERLYKNGKLDKGYTVYTNVEGDKFLYQNGKLKKGQKTANRGGETLLFVDGKLAKGYVLHEASKTLFNNGKVAEGLVKYPETDGKYYNDGKLADGEINGAEYKDGVLVAKDIASVKAINATTVEVTYKTSQKDVKAADFTIEGLEVKNAAVKQSDSKVVVLTTATQEANKEYTLVYKEADTKTFTGVSAVIPTAVTLSNGSQQAILGNQVTVEATVAVVEGQSKAGIPVTFNITNVGAVEAFTNENGVAKYTYTKYTTQDDDVVAYATGDASKRSIVGKVYWGSQARLAVSEVTTGNTIANEGKKVYKVAAPELANKYVFVAFKENVNVTPDKLVTGVKVVDLNTNSKLAGSSEYPYEVTTGGKQYVAFKLDAKGEANFTLQGTEATVTPIVFSDAQFNADYSSNSSNTVVNAGEGTLDATELQAAAPSVTFAKAFKNQLAVVAEGEQKAAAIADKNVTTKNLGGRDYTVTVTKEDGTLAPAGTIVKVGFKKDDYSDKALWFESDSTALTAVSASNLDDGTLTAVVGKDGKATFTLVGEKDGFAKPTVFFDNGQGKGAKTGLDDTDLQTTGEVTYFVDAKVANAKLDSSAAPTNKVTAATPVTFTYQSLDQNGKAYETKDFTPTFEVSASSADVVVKDADGNYVATATTDKTAEENSTVKAGQTKTFKLASTIGKTAIIVQPKDGKSADVTVTASTTDATLPVKTASVSFTKVVTAVENAVAKINAAKGYANDKDLYNTVVGEAIVTNGTTGTTGNLAAVKDAVGVAYTNKGKDLTAEEITAVVKRVTTNKAAEDAVAKAENALTQANVNDAQTAVDAAKAAGNDTTALQAKIDKAQNKVDGVVVSTVATDVTAAQTAMGYTSANKLSSTTIEQKDGVINITNELTYATNFTEFSTDSTLQTGYYAVIKFTTPAGVTKAAGDALSVAVTNGTNNAGTYDEANAFYLVLRFDSQNASKEVTVDWDGPSASSVTPTVYTINATKLGAQN